MTVRRVPPGCPTGGRFAPDEGRAGDVELGDQDDECIACGLRRRISSYGLCDGCNDTVTADMAAAFDDTIDMSSWSIGELTATAIRVDLPGDDDRALEELAVRDSLTLKVICPEPITDDQYLRARGEVADLLVDNPAGRRGHELLAAADHEWLHGNTAAATIRLVTAQAHAKVRSIESAQRWIERVELRRHLDEWLPLLHHHDRAERHCHRRRLDEEIAALHALDGDLHDPAPCRYPPISGFPERTSQLLHAVYVQLRRTLRED